MLWILSSSPIPPLSLIGFRAQFALGGAFWYLLLLMLLRFVVRREWAAVPLVIGITALGLLPPAGPAFALRVFLFTATAGMQVWMLLRLGVLPVAVGVFAIGMLRTSPLTSNLSAWYARDGMIAIAIVLALAIYGFRTTLAGRSLWRDELAGS